jgi:hypothetical protein
LIGSIRDDGVAAGYLTHFQVDIFSGGSGLPAARIEAESPPAKNKLAGRLWWRQAPWFAKKKPNFIGKCGTHFPATAILRICHFKSFGVSRTDQRHGSFRIGFSRRSRSTFSASAAFGIYLSHTVPMPGISGLSCVFGAQKPLTRHMGNGMVHRLIVIYLSDLNDKIS